MRIVAGTARGRRLEVPAGRRLRPTTDRVREAVFSSLASRGGLDEACIVDLFAGTGAIGIEALSRGAATATFVEADRAALAAIEANLAATGLASRATVVGADVLRFLAADPAGSKDPGDAVGPERPERAGNPGPFDLAFADPPYRFAAWLELLERLAPAMRRTGPAGPGFAVLESRGPVDVGRGWSTVKVLRHGDTVVTFAHPH